MSLRDAARGFIISLRAAGRDARYLKELERILAFACQYAEECEWPDVALITTSHIEEYLTHLHERTRWFGEKQNGESGSLSQSYIETGYRRLKQLFRWLVERGFAEKNPLDLIPHPKIDERVVPVIPQIALADLLAYTDPALVRSPARKFHMIRDRAALMLFIDTPARLDELTNLSVDAVSLDDGSVLVMGKGGRERVMWLGGAAVSCMWEYMTARSALKPRTRALWTNYRGLELSQTNHPSWLYRMIKRLAARAGVSDLHPHQFRHTFAVSWLLNDGSEILLRRMGGWRRSIPETYLRTVESRHAQARHAELSPADRLMSAAKQASPRRPTKRSRGRL